MGLESCSSSSSPSSVRFPARRRGELRPSSLFRRDSNAPGQYDEPEGIFPDGRHTLVECDRHSKKGSGHVDIYKLSLDGSGALERLTFFNDRPAYKASNPVVSPDGRSIAFQEARSHEPAGVGHGILVLALQGGPAKPLEHLTE